MENEEKTQVLILLKTSRGQIEGIIKMLEEDRCCVDLSKQILSVQALLKKANFKLIDQHIKHCIKEALTEEHGDEKIDEVMDLIHKYAK